MSFYRDSFPHATVTPKLDMLEDHVVPFLEEFGVGLGFLGSRELSHFNSLRENMKVKNPVDKLHAILKEYLLQVCPENLDKISEVQHRAFKKPRVSKEKSKRRPI